MNKAQTDVASMLLFRTEEEIEEEIEEATDGEGEEGGEEGDGEGEGGDLDTEILVLSLEEM